MGNFDKKLAIIEAGRALLQLELQNTHSGNIALRDGESILVTKSGTMKGRLKRSDIVQFPLNDPDFRSYQASSETGVHQRVLKQFDACIHAHSLPATLISFKMNSFEPLDFLGYQLVNPVPVLEFEQASGSEEMEEQVPPVLEKHPVCIIKAHGPFVRGGSMQEALSLLTILDHSSHISLNLVLMGLSPSDIPRLNYPIFKHERSRPQGNSKLTNKIKAICSDLYSLKLSPFQTGSLSFIDRGNIYITPSASCGEQFQVDLQTLKIEECSNGYFSSLHQAIYQSTQATSALLVHSPYSIIQSFKCLSKGLDFIIPKDVEGAYLYPKIPVLPPEAELTQIVQMADKYKVVVIAGIGALCLGMDLWDCIHHASALKNIAYLITWNDQIEKLK